MTARRRCDSVSNGGVYWGREYTWTANGNLNQATDQVLGTNRQFGYDSLNRLTSAQDVGASGGLNETYSYDSFGNIQQNGNFGFATAYTAANQLYGYSYDAAGNLLNDGLSDTMTYDANEQIQTLNGITYTYLPSGDRIGKSGSNATDYFEFAGKPIARYSGGKWTDLISGPYGLVAEVTGSGQPVYRMLDHLGTEVGQSDYQGNLLSTADYAPFGQSFNGSDQDPYKFTGKERDAESGLDYFGARYYGSSMGRFMSPDPAGLTYADPTNPQSLNLYNYVLNNPLINTDPDGHSCVTLTDGDGNQVQGDDNDGKGCAAAGINPSSDPANDPNVDQHPTVVNVNGDNGSSQPVLSSVETAAYTLGWLAGVGFVHPNFQYGPNSLGTRDMQKSAMVRNAIQKYKDEGCPISGGPLSGGHFSAYKETLTDVATGQLNPTQAEVGGYSGSINSNSDGSATMSIRNTTGLASALGVSTYAPSMTGAVDKLGTFLGMPPVNQTFRWTEANPCQQ